MRRLVPTALSLVLASVATTSVARADSTDAPFVSSPPRRVVVEGQAGVSMPLGFYGLAADVDVARSLAVSAGVGMDRMRDFSPDVTPRYALMPRFRFAPGPARLSLSAGLGLSYGKRPPWGDAATRVDGELSVEVLFGDGVRARAFGGFGSVLDPNPGATTAERQTFYGGLALGYAVFPNPTVSPAESLSVRGWYGWQALALDGLAAVLFAAHDIGHANNDPDLLLHRHVTDRAAAGIYLVSAPIVHVAHRNYLRAAASVGLRLVGPALGVVLGAQQKTNQEGESLAFQGAVVGAVVAAAIDDFALAWERPAPTPEIGPPPR